jgi:hypothetical protein
MRRNRGSSTVIVRGSAEKAAETSIEFDGGVKLEATGIFVHLVDVSTNECSDGDSGAYLWIEVLHFGVVPLEKKKGVLMQSVGRFFF